MPIQTLIRKLRKSERELQSMGKLTQTELRRAYGPGKWNARQILAHLADAELVLYYRFLKTVAEEGSPIVPFDQDRWTKELRGGERPVAESLALIHAIRTALMHHLTHLSPTALKRRAVHPERGEMTALQIAGHVHAHAAHHLEQLKAIREKRIWNSKVATR